MAVSSSVRLWWKEHSQSLCRLGEVFLSFGSGVLTIVSFGSPFWIDQDSGDHQGLWQECSGIPSKCTSLADPSSAVLAVRALLIMALITGIIGWVLSMICLVLHRPKFLFSASFAFGLQAFFLFIGLLAYTKKATSVSGTHGWAYSIGWIGFFISAASSVTFFLVGLYIYRNPTTPGLVGPQIYAPLNQWEDDYSTDSEDERL